MAPFPVPTPAPSNEPVYGYEPRSSDRAALKAAIEQFSSDVVEIPLRIGSKRIRTGTVTNVVAPHKREQTLALVHQASRKEAAEAIDAALEARPAWSEMPWPSRRAIFLRAAELAAQRHRYRLNAATMLGQSKTCHQAEIDAACELVDFLRWNVHFAERIYAEQPVSSPGVFNRMDARPLEGFVFAVAPFNFTAICANLCTAPALLGNVVVLKPASTATLSAHVMMEVLEEAGLPPGVINFVPGPAQEISDAVLAHAHLAGVHFTGSTAVFESIWTKVARGIDLKQYRSYPRLVGETGGKNFVVVHPSADEAEVVAGLLRGGYEYQGQKCSAASRIYVPQTMWHRGLRDRLVAETGAITVGDVTDFRNFMGAVIDEKAHHRILEYMRWAESASGHRLLAGGEKDARTSDAAGWFVAPSIYESEDPSSRLMVEEIFGPIMTVYPYPDEGNDNGFTDVLARCDRTSRYGLTGAIFARDRKAIEQASQRLRNAAGNLYINDKPTGAVVGQQPFGGARASGTNDKAGSLINLWRWVSARVIKENHAPPRAYRYPWMSEP